MLGHSLPFIIVLAGRNCVVWISVPASRSSISRKLSSRDATVRLPVGIAVRPNSIWFTRNAFRVRPESRSPYPKFPQALQGSEEYLFLHVCVHTLSQIYLFANYLAHATSTGINGYGHICCQNRLCNASTRSFRSIPCFCENSFSPIRWYESRFSR